MTIGTYDEIADKLLDRFGQVVTDIEFSIAPKTDAERGLLADIPGRRWWPSPTGDPRAGGMKEGQG